MNPARKILHVVPKLASLALEVGIVKSKGYSQLF